MLANRRPVLASYDRLREGFFSVVEKRLHRRYLPPLIRAVGRRAVVLPYARLRKGFFRMLDQRVDRRYGIDTAGEVWPTGWQEIGANHYQGVPSVLFFGALRHLPQDHHRYTFVDIGAGKGRALVLAARAGYGRVVGIELDPHLAEAARRNCPTAEVIEGDATAFELPSGPTMLFLCNPFREAMMERFVSNVKEQLPHSDLWLVYVNPVLDGMIPWTRVVRRYQLAIYRLAE